MNKGQKKNVLFLPKYPRLGASSRLRTYQYLPLWEEKGVSFTVKPLFNEQYLRELYNNGNISKRNVLWCYFERWKVLWTVKKYNWVVIEKELFPYLPYFFEKIAYKIGPHYILDYDDAIFHHYNRKGSWWRGILKNKIDKVMAKGNQVWAGNPYLATTAEESGAAEVTVLPTVIDLHRYPVLPKKDSKTIKIGWVGSPTTLKYLERLKPVFEVLMKQFDIRLCIIAHGEGIGLKSIEENLVWSENIEVELIRDLDIGLMPLEDTPWEQGKCAYKLIQYMACCLPVIASPIGMNKEVVIHGHNGYWANDHQDWEHYLKKLIENPALRAQMGQEGRKIVEEKYTLQHNWKKVKSLIGF
ncbi:glycosyltransferase family 4 protein [Echinicola sp. 20G]|uniref:glycosyltransferase family 4 protein n=1 Tax=Echinicola sp. 20G TaxID=2781961 RepID=UPI00191016B9|nr:glycosyltransferase family 4 protein [Echinicola sp. 20G]